MASYLKAGVETPSFLLLLARCWIQPHKAIIPQDNGCATRQVVEMCFLPLDQRRGKLDQYSLTQLIVRGSRDGVSLNENKNNDCYSYYWTNTVTPVLAWLHWHPVSFRVNLNILLIVFKILNRLACPLYLSGLINVHTPVRALRSANQLIKKKKKIGVIELFSCCPESLECISIS